MRFRKCAAQRPVHHVLISFQLRLPVVAARAADRQCPLRDHIVILLKLRAGTACATAGQAIAPTRAQCVIGP